MTSIWIVFVFIAGTWEMTQPALIFENGQECLEFAQEQEKEIPEQYKDSKVTCFEYKKQ